MPVSSPLTPRSVLRHRPIASEKTTKQIPTVIRASRSSTTHQEAVPPFVCSSRKPLVKQGYSPLNLVSLGIGMIVAILAVMLGQLLLSWGSTTWDDVHYGRPRTYQTDVFTGSEPGATPSHFLVVNLHGHIEIFELPGGDPTKTRVYLGPQIAGSGAELVPVTLHFVDPQHTHYPDMLVQFQGTQVLFHNVHGTFHLATP